MVAADLLLPGLTGMTFVMPGLGPGINLLSEK